MIKSKERNDNLLGFYAVGEVALHDSGVRRVSTSGVSQAAICTVV